MRNHLLGTPFLRPAPNLNNLCRAILLPLRLCCLLSLHYSLSYVSKDGLVGTLRFRERPDLFWKGFGAYQDLAQKTKAPCPRFSGYFRIFEGSRAISKPAGNPVRTKLQLKRFPKRALLEKGSFQKFFQPRDS